MIANAAFLAAFTVFLIVGWLAGELAFLAPYKAGLFRLHGAVRSRWCSCLLFFNLCAAYYAPRSMDVPAGHRPKTSPPRHQLTTSDAVLEDLGQ